MTTFIIISAAVFLGSCLFGAIEGRIDAVYGTDPNHKKDWRKRLLIAVPVSILVVRIFLYKLVPHDDWWLYDKPFVSVVATVFMILAMGFLYGFFLDITHNISKGNPLTYVGNTADSDKFARDNNLDGWVLAKLAGGILSMIFYFAWVVNAIS